MKAQVYKFLAEEGLTDREKLFFWFMTKVLEDGGVVTTYTIANYDLKILLRGHSIGEFLMTSIPPAVKKWFDIYFVTPPRQIIRLNKQALKHFIFNKKQGIVCSKVDVEFTDPKVQTMYVYLLGVFAGSNSLYYDEKFFGVGDSTDRNYHNDTRNLQRLEMNALLNGTFMD
jgi:hypothetical protein